MWCTDSRLLRAQNERTDETEPQPGYKKSEQAASLQTYTYFRKIRIESMSVDHIGWPTLSLNPCQPSPVRDPLLFGDFRKLLTPDVSLQCLFALLCLGGAITSEPACCHLDNLTFLSFVIVTSLEMACKLLFPALFEKHKAQPTWVSFFVSFPLHGDSGIVLTAEDAAD